MSRFQPNTIFLSTAIVILSVQIFYVHFDLVGQYLVVVGEPLWAGLHGDERVLAELLLPVGSHLLSGHPSDTFAVFTLLSEIQISER
jgi:hypothetical protein